MSAEATAWAFALDNLSNSQRLILIYLSNSADCTNMVSIDRNGVCSLERLAAFSNETEERVEYILDCLRAGNLIDFVEGGISLNAGAPNEY
jgi:hypothetical protein|tara:strand:- start:304 stop:576 length:273 start_codon:yes stop_codon:yes gene_type:complete